MLTQRQKETLDFIKSYFAGNGNMPTQHEVADALKIKSVSTAHQHFKELIKKGYLTQWGGYGAVEINAGQSREGLVPIIGTIAAGSPIEAIENDLQETVDIGKPAPKGEFYALRVAGDSMVDDGIFNGDVVVIKRQSYADNGQTVVAIIDEGQATLKKIFKTSRGYKLQPANQAMLPIFRQEVEVRGIVWEVRRNFAELSSNKHRVKTWRTLDLFAGIGGIRSGFEKAGFGTVFANDFEEACRDTYDANFKHPKLVVDDVTKIHADDLPDFDFLLAGFPCQAFSVAGYRQGFKDAKGRGNLFFDIARIIDARKPEGFLLENVKNLRTHDGGNTYRVIERTLNSLGYKIKTMVLNSMEYGNVPQNRERMYIVGFKDHGKTDKFEFPSSMQLTIKPADLLDKKVDDKYYYNDKPLYKKLIGDVTEMGQIYQWRRQYVRKNKRGVCPTLTANMGMGGHNVPIVLDRRGIRKLTPRECARFQGFPDTFKLPESLPDSKLYKQIGNSVTVPVVKRIALQILKVV